MTTQFPLRKQQFKTRICARSFAWTFCFTQVKFLSCTCCNGFEKNKFQGFWQFIYMLVQPKTPKIFKTEIEMLPAFICLFTLSLGNLFILDYLRIHTNLEQLLSTHPNNKKNQGNDSMNVWNCFIKLIYLNYCQIKTFTLEAAVRAKVSQLQ